MNPKDQLRLPFMFKKIKVIDSKNKSLIGIEGIIFDETKNTFLLKTRKGLKKIIKENCTFKLEFEYKGKKRKIIFDGKIIKKRPEERIKIKIKK